jgi:hypothetical protein
MYAAYYKVDGIDEIYPVGLFDSLYAARKGCVKEGMKFKSVTLYHADFNWQEFADRSSNFSRAVARVSKGPVGFEFHIRAYNPEKK